MKCIGVVFLVMGLLVVSVADAQFVCNVPVAGLMACRPAVTPPSPAPPNAACCSALSMADMNCLCTFKNSPQLRSLGIDPNLAVKLPSKCRLRNAPRC